MTNFVSVKRIIMERIKALLAVALFFAALIFASPVFESKPIKKKPSTYKFNPDQTLSADTLTVADFSVR